MGWGHARLPLPEGVHPVLRALIGRCFAEPAERPSFSEILDILKPLQASPLQRADVCAIFFGARHRKTCGFIVDNFVMLHASSAEADPVLW